MNALAGDAPPPPPPQKQASTSLNSLALDLNERGQLCSH